MVVMNVCLKHVVVACSLLATRYISLGLTAQKKHIRSKDRAVELVGCHCIWCTREIGRYEDLAWKEVFTSSIFEVIIKSPYEMIIL